MLTILWDNDGVLVDTEGLYFQSTQERPGVLRAKPIRLTRIDRKRLADGSD
jgi:phosphoglycolate phosphatase-like HAD superfamily hydrolase